MDERLTDEFLVRFHRWASNDAIREVNEGCPLIRSVRGIAASTFIEYFESLSEQQRIDLIQALVNRFHPRALEVYGKSLDQHDHALIDRYLTAASEIRGRYVDQFVFSRKNKANKRKLRNHSVGP